MSGKQNTIAELSSNFLLDQNIIDLYGEIDDVTARSIIAQIQYLDYRFIENKVPEEKRIIILQINSPGGSVSAGLGIYDTMNYAKAKICTIAVGMAASMGAFLLSAGTRGLRKALPHSEILIHQPLGGASGQASDVIIAAEHIKRIRKDLNEMLALHTGQPLKKIRRDTDRDYIMTAEEAKAYGIIDEVIKTAVKAAGGNEA
ncbi:MAG: ATP-dependent Clp protease proteolytic subunit [Clostridiaceae bacterium]|jgi:ATP-dependent Clp protease protease subunit|nr:ATP-dependent Clp protease proteolytic subunit [Clostridiaceae bacterium]